MVGPGDQALNVGLNNLLGLVLQLGLDSKLPNLLLKEMPGPSGDAFTPGLPEGPQELSMNRTG